MAKNQEKGEQNSEMNDDTSPEIRVTDRRRFYVNENGSPETNNAVESPNLKPSYVQELEARTRAAEQQVQEVQSRFEQLRKQLQQEMDETRQRLNRTAEERAQREKAAFIAALLPVLDNLQRATEAAETGGSTEVLGEGVRQTAASFENALGAAGVQAMESVGQPFDPELHEAVDTVEVSPEMERKVIAEYTRGYRMGERLLRPARVKVGRAFERSSQAAD